MLRGMEKSHNVRRKPYNSASFSMYDKIEKADSSPQSTKLHPSMVCTVPFSLVRGSVETRSLAHEKASVAREAEIEERVRRKRGATAAKRIFSHTIPRRLKEMYSSLYQQ